MSADGHLEPPGPLADLGRALAFARGRHADITLTELTALIAVAEHQGITVSSLARLCGFTTATASRSLRSMAPNTMPGALGPKRGLVQLMRGPRENRSRHAFLTPDGQEFCKQIARISSGGRSETAAASDVGPDPA